MPLLTGAGRFTDDINISGQAYGAFVRSPVAHGVLRGVDGAAALDMPGVLAVITGADLKAAGLGDIPPAISFPGKDGMTMAAAPKPVLAYEKVRHAGEAVALVIADTPARAADAAEAVILDVESLPAVPQVADALADGAAQVWESAPGNIAFEWEYGDGVDAAFDGAAHVSRVELLDTRLAPVSMEPRGGIGEWDDDLGRYTLTAPTQGVGLVSKMFAAQVFGVEPDQLRVLTHDVGGGFGMKAHPYPEYAAILFAARQVGRPVKWCNTRLESFLADTAGRDTLIAAEMAFDGDGLIQGLRVNNRVGMGAYLTTFSAVFATNNTKNCLASVYTIPAIHIDVTMTLTNTAPLGPYRGAGRPEAIIAIEQLLDTAAAEMGLDRVEIRRRNLIAPAAMPYTTPNGPIYDSGEFEACLDSALALADWDGFSSRRAASEKDGRLRGIGIACFLEVAGGILEETADLRFEGDGYATVRLGVQAMGQSHLSTYTRLIGDRLGIPPSKVRLIEGDSLEAPPGTPSVASRSMMMAGSAMAMSCDTAIEKGRALAGHVLEAAIEDVEFVAGAFRIKGTDRQIGIIELADQVSTLALPEELAGGLDATEMFESAQMTFPNGCHVCEVEIDPETGAVDVARYAAVDDVGNVFDEMVVEGQIHGGIAQGLGQVLGECVVYDADGQLMTGSFMDYMMPRADDLPMLDVGHHSVPATTNPLGAKGAGESGVAGALPSGMAAVADALASAGKGPIDLPMTPARIWAALQE
ncbi:MAG: xanthine dehydrogenase family protein molybdopterin-binding subunit [Rhodospirillaceae bacterium]|nr:xanthine dehydrogenase family protein molybdopterin-binding subunit [Rhodospirillaceae bacterium]MBT5945808.1 xanthine dehydrogenase family protein molybdopterin-binding subunit [Rhodospirillaceae bacterium]MBT6403340.1 xanthine dehydrogenase family protein molybdopterin-binding subunit [Rhodospirillaceae bacterium]